MTCYFKWLLLGVLFAILLLTAYGQDQKGSSYAATDISNDIQDLQNSTAIRDLSPELLGWQSSIGSRSSIPQYQNPGRSADLQARISRSGQANAGVSNPATNITNPIIEGSNRTIPSNMSIDSSAFYDAGCSSSGVYLNCSKPGLDKQFSCFEMRNATNDLGGLTPKLPIAECLVRADPNYENFSTYEGRSHEGITISGGLFPYYKRYIIKTGEEFVSVKNKEEFRSQFAPVDSPEEALSFAVATTDSVSNYGAFPEYNASRHNASIPAGYFPVAEKIEPTYVEDEMNGTYKVHLFGRATYGCGTHPWYAIDYLVTRDGDVIEIGRQEVFDSTMNLCVD